MSFGHWIEIADDETKVRLGPIEREQAKLFVAADAGYGMQSYEVQRYLGRPIVQTAESELAWWDRMHDSDQGITWGVFVPDGADWKLIGNSSLRLDGAGGKRASSGFMIFDRAYWNRGIAKTAHHARTWYGFRELDLLAIDSGAADLNVGSNKALLGQGYVKTGTAYCFGCVGSQVFDVNHYLMVNPLEEAWRYFWRRSDSLIPEAFHEARELTLACLVKADKICHFL